MRVIRRIVPDSDTEESTAPDCGSDGSIADNETHHGDSRDEDSFSDDDANDSGDDDEDQEQLPPRRATLRSASQGDSLDQRRMSLRSASASQCPTAAPANREPAAVRHAKHTDTSDDEEVSAGAGMSEYSTMNASSRTSIDTLKHSTPPPKLHTVQIRQEKKRRRLVEESGHDLDFSVSAHAQDVSSRTQTPQKRMEPFNPPPEYPRMYQVSVTFLRDFDNCLFEGQPELSKSEIFILFTSTLSRCVPRPASDDQSFDHVRERMQRFLLGPAEDIFFTTALSHEATMREVKCHIRRLLNVHFQHPNPETLDFTLEAFDETTEVDCGAAARFNSTTLSSLCSSAQLLIIVTSIRKNAERMACRRSDWVSDIQPMTWTYAVIETKRHPEKVYWRLAIRQKGMREIRDRIPTDLLWKSPSIRKDSMYTGAGAAKLAALYGVGL